MIPIGFGSGYSQFRITEHAGHCSDSQTTKNVFLLQDFRIFGPGLVPLDSDRKSVQNAGVLASGTLIWTPFVPKLIFGNPSQKKVLKYARAMPGQGGFLRMDSQEFLYIGPIVPLSSPYPWRCSGILQNFFFGDGSRT